MSGTGIRILKFWTHYKPYAGTDLEKVGTLVGVDMVSYCQVGEADKATNINSVSAMSKVRPLTQGGQDLAAQYANAVWDAIRPAYEAWKAGHEAPLSGTPLGAWPGVSPEQAEALRTAGIRTVEEVRDMGDSVRSRLNMPNTIALREQARLYLTASDQSKSAALMAKVESDNAALKDELAETKELLQRLLAAAEQEDTPKRRGRPPKVHAEAEEVDAA